MGACRGLSLMSGGLDSQLAVRVLQRAGAEVEAVMFVSPFFKDDGTAAKAAAALGVKLRRIDFTADILALVKSPPHGFGGAMNPCIDCHAKMIARAGELMAELGYDFVATGEVQGQRPMSQNRQSLETVAKASGMRGRLVRPLSAKLLAPTIPELEGKLDRERLLDISGRGRERQIALAAEFGIAEYPSPAGGCRLTEDGFARRLKDLMSHEGLAERTLVELLAVGRRFRLPGGSGVILGRDGRENALLGGVVLPDGFRARLFRPTEGRIGPTALVPDLKRGEDAALVQELVNAYCKGTGESDRVGFKPYQIC